jgi:hypothetical protein
MWAGDQIGVPVALLPGNRPVTNSSGGWVGPRTILDLCRKSYPHRNWIPGPSVPYVSRYTFYPIPVLLVQTD